MSKILSLTKNQNDIICPEIWMIAANSIIRDIEFLCTITEPAQEQCWIRITPCIPVMYYKNIAEYVRQKTGKTITWSTENDSDITVQLMDKFSKH